MFRIVPIKNCNICCTRDIKLSLKHRAVEEEEEDNNSEEDPFADVDQLEAFSESEEDEQ